MIKKALLPILLSLPLLGHAEEAFVKLTPEQFRSLAVVVQPLDSFSAGGGRRLPAQVVVPPRQVEVLGAPLPGAVTAVLAAYGETVKRGQPLARLQGPQMLEAQRDYLQAQAQAEVATSNLRRDESLFADGIISASRLAATRATERQAAAQLAQTRQALRLAGLNDPGSDARRLGGVAEIRAPFDGVVLEAPVQPGQRVEATATLFKLGRLSPLWLEIQASPAQAAGLAPGDPVSVAGCARAGSLTLVAPQLNPATQSLLLRAELQKPDGCVRPFQFVQAQVTPSSPQAANARRVPTGALVHHQGQTWLFVEAPGGFKPLAVKVLDEAESSSLVAVEAPGTARIATRGVAALKAVWLGLGADRGK